MGLFGDLFDFNNDGKLDAFEKAAEFGVLADMMDEEENEEDDDDEEDFYQGDGLLLVIVTIECI